MRSGMLRPLQKFFYTKDLNMHIINMHMYKTYFQV